MGELGGLSSVRRHIKATKCPSDGFAAGRHPWGNSYNSYCFSRGDKIENAHVSNRAIAGWGSNWVPRGLFTGNGWGNNTGTCNGINAITDGTSNTVAISEMAVFNGNTRDVKGSYCTCGEFAEQPESGVSLQGPRRRASLPRWESGKHPLAPWTGLGGGNVDGQRLPDCAPAQCGVSGS